MNDTIRRNSELISIVIAFGMLYGTWELTQWAELYYGKLPLEGAEVLAEKPKVSGSGLDGLFPVLIAGSGLSNMGAPDLIAIESAFRVKKPEAAKPEPNAPDAPAPKPPTCAEQIKPLVTVDAFTAESVVLSGVVLRKNEQLSLPIQGPQPTLTAWDGSKGTVLLSCGKERITLTAL